MMCFSYIPTILATRDDWGTHKHTRQYVTSEKTCTLIQLHKVFFHLFIPLFCISLTLTFYLYNGDGPVGWGCRIRRLHLCRGVRPTCHPPTSECDVYDTKQSDGEVPVILELWGMGSDPLLPSLPGQLWPGVLAPDRVQSMNQTKLCNYAKLNCLKLTLFTFNSV